MSGKELKKILAAEGINLSELAHMLGFANDQRLHSALKAEDVKSGLIELIARATNISERFTSLLEKRRTNGSTHNITRKEVSRLCLSSAA